MTRQPFFLGIDQGSPGDDIFDILVEEQPYLDTGATPTWQFTANPQPNGLFGTAGGAYVESGPLVYQTVDAARPVIGYTLAALGGTEAYLYLSETVYGNNAASTGVDAADFERFAKCMSGENVTADPACAD